MKYLKALLIIFQVIGFYFIAYSQNTPLLQLEKAHKYWLEAKNNPSAKLYHHIAQEYLQNKPALLEAYYKLGTIYYSDKNYQKAVGYFKKMLAIKLSKKDQQSVIMRTFIKKANIPYQQYMHLAYSYLGNIAQLQKHYQQAIAYYKIAEQKYPAWDQKTEMSQLITKEMYAECYGALQKTDSVLYVLIPFVLNAKEYAPEGLESLKKSLAKIEKISKNRSLENILKKTLANVTMTETFIEEAYLYKVQVKILETEVLLHQIKKISPMLPFQQKNQLAKCKKELNFIFDEILRKE